VNVNAMLRSISAEQFAEWAAYDTLEPFGEWRDDWRSAEIVTMIANVNRDTKKRKEPYKTTDFLVKFGERSEEETKTRQTPKEQLSIAKMIAGAFNTTKRKKRP
jgi:hypothetical protein